MHFESDLNLQQRLRGVSFFFSEASLNIHLDFEIIVWKTGINRD